MLNAGRCKSQPRCSGRSRANLIGFAARWRLKKQRPNSWFDVQSSGLSPQSREHSSRLVFCDKEFSCPFYLPRALIATVSDKSKHRSFGTLTTLTKIVEQRHCKRNANLIE